MLLKQNSCHLDGSSCLLFFIYFPGLLDKGRFTGLGDRISSKMKKQGQTVQVCPCFAVSVPDGPGGYLVSQSCPQQEQSQPQWHFPFFLFLRRITTATATMPITRAATTRSAGFIFRLLSHIPRARQISRAARAAIQATTHCQITTPTAHLPPSSRLMEATEATQGVYSRENTSMVTAETVGRAA